MFKKLFLAAALGYAASASALPLSSQHALVFDEQTGQVLLEKNANEVVPIASVTKLMTAMVVLDAKLDMEEPITIDRADVDILKHSSSRVPVGAVLPRKSMLQLALMSSDNRAAAALARTYPGGNAGFDQAVRDKLIALGMHNTSIEEPTGLSPYNRSTATDLVKMATAASYYPEITRITTETGDLIDINGQAVQYKNTNRLVGKKGWDIQLSKTGFTREAGRCLVMRVQSAGKNVIVVLLNAKEAASRLLDAENVQRYLEGEPIFAVRPTELKTVSIKAKARKKSVLRTKSRSAIKAAKKARVR